MHRCFWMCLAVASMACSRSEPSRPNETNADAAHHATDDHPKKITLSAQVISDAKIRTAPATREALRGMVDLPGEIASDPDKSARVASPVAGRIAKVAFKEGAAIKKGDLLVVIRVPELGRIRSAQASALVKAKAARSNAERVKTLASRGLAGEQEALNAAAEADSLEAEANALAEQLTALGTGASGAGAELPIRAPLAGTVVTRDAVLGQPVSPDQTLATVADVDEVWFLGRLFEQSLTRVEVGSIADVTFDVLPSEHFAGKVAFLGKQIDPTNRAVIARIPLTNRNELLRLGLFGTAHVGTREDAGREAVVTAPRAALVTLGTKSVVFVGRATDATFEVRDVITGDSVGDKVAIRSGLHEGEEIVVDGAFTVKGALLKSTIAEE